MNASVYSLGYPENVVREYNNWLLLLRRKQITIGSLVLVVKEEYTSISQLTDDAHCECRYIIKDIETNMKNIFNYDIMNYLVLMMVDKHVHYHIIPRYKEEVSFNGIEYRDVEWPNPPNMNKIQNMSDDEYRHLYKYLTDKWNK